MIGFIVRGRRGGKTTQALQLMTTNPQAIMIVANANMAGEVSQLLASRGVERAAERVFTVAQMRKGGGPRRHADIVVIDNIDLMLHELFPGVMPHTVIATATGVNL